MSIEYFLDNLEEWELESILDCLPYADKNTWETARLQAYVTAQVNSTKQLEPTDIIKLPWDNGGYEKEITAITDDEKERLETMAANFWKGSD